jgi:hypothetical protein
MVIGGVMGRAGGDKAIREQKRKGLNGTHMRKKRRNRGHTLSHTDPY